MARLKLLGCAGLLLLFLTYFILLSLLLLRPLHTHTYKLNARAEGRHTYTGIEFFTGAKKVDKSNTRTKTANSCNLETNNEILHAHTIIACQLFCHSCAHIMLTVIFVNW